MTISMYEASVPVFAQMLGSLSSLLEKAAAHAQARNIEPSVLLDARLYPDMFPLSRQVQVACDAAKNGCARIAGVEAPKYEDKERSIDELKARIATTLAFIGGIAREAIDGQEDREISIPLRERKLEMKAMPYLLHWVLPNFFFHVTTAYDILRHNGVELGKRDYLGKFM